MNFTKKQMALAVGLVLSAVVSQSANAGNKYWVCGDNTWNNPSCWSNTSGGAGGTGQPIASDRVDLVSSSTNRTVTYVNTAYPSDKLGAVFMDGQNGGRMILNQSNDPLSVFDLTVGLMGKATFNQIGGFTTVDQLLSIGSGLIYAGNGSYNLGGGTLLSNQTALGYGMSSGSFDQSGGTHTATHGLFIGFAGGTGSYNLSSGSLSTNIESIGSETGALSRSHGNFTQSGGTHTVSVELRIGYGSGLGTYNLSNGSLLAAKESIGSGTFNQNGGTHTVSDNLYLGSGGSRDHGIYNLNGGTHTVGNTLYFGNVRGGSGSGTYNLNGGILTVGKIVVGDGIGIINLNGGTLNVTDPSGVRNTGTLGLSGGTVTGSINNIGALDISNTVNLAGNLTQTAGTTTVNGTLNTTGVDIQGGQLKGSGNITGSVLNSAGTVAVGNSPGSMTINGDYTQSLAGIFDVELGGLIAGSEYDTLNVTGTANLDGTLNVSLFDLGSGLFNPHQGDTFDILSAEHLNGSFGSLLLAPLDAGLKWNIAYLIDANGTTDVVRLSVQSVPVPAAAWLLGSGLLGLIGVARRKVA